MFQILNDRELTAPVLIVAFDGWVNAGSAGSLAAEVLAGGTQVMAEFDGDLLFDYRQSRPTVDFAGGVNAGVTWPSMSIRHRRIGGRDLLVLSGPEPNWNWQRFGKEVASLASTYGVAEHVSLGGIPWAAPHTRAVEIVVTASSGDRLELGDGHPEGRMRVPGAAVSTVEYAVGQSGIPTMGFWARVPHYVGTAFYAGALALLERVGAHLDIELPVGDLARLAAEQREELDSIAEGRPDLKALVGQLETITDENRAVSGESLAAEIERFLRQRED